MILLNHKEPEEAVIQFNDPAEYVRDPLEIIQDLLEHGVEDREQTVVDTEDGEIELPW